MNTTKHQQAQARLFELTGMDADWYNEFVYNKGTEWLNERYKRVRGTIRVLETKKAFWNWWRNQMNLRLVEFLEVLDLPAEMYGNHRHSYLTPEWQKYLLMQYMAYNSTFKDVYPNDVVWRMAEKEMYQAVTEEMKHNG